MFGNFAACARTLSALPPTPSSAGVSTGLIASLAGLPGQTVTLGRLHLETVAFSNSTLKNQILHFAFRYRGCTSMRCFILDILEYFFIWASSRKLGLVFPFGSQLGLLVSG